ncbi:hypothetical protein M9H77_28216 [Catharanthus roseus]|uniref:Uncharacterized protein n=1 Tax=Catharanthus roseus TaxID=4058 RepID=A0ACC0AIZ8_CATRO|nr:hypothetical protein M9H77_28216 [Catharanthus roseus]
MHNEEKTFKPLKTLKTNILVRDMLSESAGVLSPAVNGSTMTLSPGECKYSGTFAGDISPPFQPHLSHTPVPYEPYGSAHPPSHPIDTVYHPYLHAPTVVRPRIPYRSAIQEPILYDRGQPRQIGVEFFYQMLGATHQDSSCSTHGYSQAEYGVSSSYPYVLGPADRVFEGDRVVGKEQERVRSLHIQGEADERGDDDGDGGDDDGDGGDDDQDDDDDDDDDGDEEQTVYVALVAPISGSDRRSRHEKREGFDRQLYVGDEQTSQSHQVRAACYLQYILGSSLFSDKSGNIVPARLWPLLQDASRADAKELAGCWLLLEAPSHLLTESWTSVPAIPASSCTDDYMDWYLPHSHPRIQNPRNILSGYNVSVAPAMPPKALLDLIVRECHRQDIDGDEFRLRVRDLLRKHYIAL